MRFVVTQEDMAVGMVELAGRVLDGTDTGLLLATNTCLWHVFFLLLFIFFYLLKVLDFCSAVSLVLVEHKYPSLKAIGVLRDRLVFKGIGCKRNFQWIGGTLLFFQFSCS